MEWILFLILAVSLDLIIGDPPGWPHPIRLIGFVISKYEKLIRREKWIPLKAGGYLLTFWDAFKNNLTAINRYLRETNNFSEEFRNRNGGNLLFRPIGLLPFVKACIQIKQTTNCDFEQILGNMDNLCFDIAQKPWRFVVWDPVANKMIMNSSTITQLLIIYLYDEKILNENELTKLKQGYASKISYEDEIENVLDGIK